MPPPWSSSREFVPESEGGWSSVWGPSAVPFAPGYRTPDALTVDQIEEIVEAFAQAAIRALRAGFEIIELHGAHGYLIHEFLSPLSNHRTDEYGGNVENRARFAVRVVTRLREVWPGHLPLLVRLSATDWAEGGWDLERTVRLAQVFRDLGVDRVDCSSGGNVAGAKIPVGPGYQVPFAEAVRTAGMPSVAVGLITDPHQADEIVRSGKADLVMLARELLRDPYWPLHAALALGVDVEWPIQYQRAKP
jgi:2,4-dienoyl-CoA reductase-like NADH-dependent reductase (Old Yellow Enzyme family)